MDVSKEHIAGGIPTWEVLVDVEQFVAEHPGWDLMTASQHFVNKSGTPMSERTFSRTMFKIAEQGGFGTVMEFVKNAPVWTVENENIICVAYHTQPKIDPEHHETLFVYAIAPGIAGKEYNGIHFVHGTYWPLSTIRIRGRFSYKEIPLHVRYGAEEKEAYHQKGNIVPELENPNVLDGSRDHCWLHEILSFSRRSFQLSADPILYCPTADPVSAVEILTYHTNTTQKVFDLVEKFLRQEAKSLTASQNEYRLLAATMIEARTLEQFKEALNAVQGVDF